MKNPRFYPNERNRYFYGKLLTVRDFESEQKYFNDKRRLANRLLHGAGVVCGLQVVAVDDKTVSVETGVAIDYTGREIVVASPVTQKLSMIEGFTNNEYAKNVYLCIAYDEKGKEPVYSVASSSTYQEEVGEYNRIQESYRLYIREEAPDPASFGFSRLIEDTFLLYSDEQLRIWQKIPHYVNPEELLDVTLMVEKNLQVPRVEIEYGICGQHFFSKDGSAGGAIHFIEPENARESEYSVTYSFRVGETAGILDEIGIKDDRVRIKIGDRALDINCGYNHILHVIAEPVMDRIMKSYRELNLDQYSESDPDQPIYLARIGLLQIGPSFMIEKVDQVPFNEYAYNVSDLFHMGLLGQGKEQSAFKTRAAAYMLEADAEPQFAVRYRPERNEFNFELGVPRATTVLGEATTGVTEIELEANPRTGKSYFSEEIEHGLGPGPVFLIAGVEESSDDELLEAPQHSEQIFFGAYEVFQKSPYESLATRTAIGSVLYPQRGSFRIGIRCQSANRTKIRIRWWAYRTV